MYYNVNHQGSPGCIVLPCYPWERFDSVITDIQNGPNQSWNKQGNNNWSSQSGKS